MILKERFETSAFCKFIEKFFLSDYYFLMLTICMMIPFGFRKYFVGLWLLSLFACFAMIFSRNLMPSFVAFIYASMSVFEMHRASYEEIFSAIYIVIPVVISFIFHLIVYPVKNYKPCKTFFCQIAVSIAITLAGIGATTSKEYFALPTVYFSIFLGFGLLGILVALDMYTTQNSPIKADLYFSKTMIFIGLTVILMWICAILQDLPYMEKGFEIPYRQWKNNVGNLLLISIPCALYYGIKSRHSWLYFTFAIFLFLTITISSSRGSLIMAIVLAPFEIVLFFIALKDKTQKIINAVILAVFITSVAIILLANDMFILKFIESELKISKDESRWDLYKTGIENFLRFPVFGVGLGYKNDDVFPLNDMSIFWYHSTPVQIIASMGIVGAICYAYQLFIRLKVLIKRNFFNLFMLCGFAGFEGYSCVNTGDFSPIPFAILIVMIFSVCEKSNSATENENKEKGALSVEQNSVNVVESAEK